MKTNLIPPVGFAIAVVTLGILAPRGLDHQRISPLISLTTAASPTGQEEMNRLLQARYQTTSALLEMEQKRLGGGVTTLGRVCEVARWVRDAAVELPVGKEERRQALTKYLALARQLEENVGKAAEQGAAAPSDRDSARYLRLDAEVTFLRAQLQESR